MAQQSAGRFRLLEFFNHSRALAALCLIEFLERLSFFGMRSIMVLFMVAPVARGGMGLPDSEAVAIYGLYLASAYLTSLGGDGQRIGGSGRATRSSWVRYAARWVTAFWRPRALRLRLICRRLHRKPGFSD
jgi:hypothetical protein